MDRRGFLRLSAGAAGAILVPAPALADPLRLTLHPGEEGNPIGADFIGLSYETAQLANPSFFSAANGQLTAFLGQLGSTGVLRIGGNTSAYSVWTPEATPATVPSDEVAGPDTGRKPPPRRPVTPDAIRNLRDFLDATGWSLIYGLNMGGEGPDIVADEAHYVATTVGPKLRAFQLCNEPDLFRRNGVRGPNYDYREFAVEWRRYFEAVRARVPQAPFAGPDTAYNNDWLRPFAEEFKNDVAFLSQHYYALGPPSDPAMTMARLLAPDPKLAEELDGMRRTRDATGLPFRMAETNSCYGGGKEFVSDTFASALWGAELMFELAAAGGSGINFHGGGYGWYTPIAGTPAAGFVARPLYYGMLMFAQAGPGVLVTAEVENAAVQPLFSAYALKTPRGGLKAALFNKHRDRDFVVTVDPETATTAASVLRLSAPRIDDTTDTTFGGAPVGLGGAWSPYVSEQIEIEGGSARIAMPRASAALVSFDIPR